MCDCAECPVDEVLKRLARAARAAEVLQRVTLDLMSRLDSAHTDTLALKALLLAYIPESQLRTKLRLEGIADFEDWKATAGDLRQAGLN